MAEDKHPETARKRRGRPRKPDRREPITIALGPKTIRKLNELSERLLVSRSAIVRSIVTVAIAKCPWPEEASSETEIRNIVEKTIGPPGNSK